ncbi:MAG: hypothetical protein ACFB14_06410 [Leptolyngbyaceae cyanobacterium]
MKFVDSINLYGQAAIFNLKTFQIKVAVPKNRQLIIELPEDVAEGNYQVVIAMNSTPVKPQVGCRPNALAGQVQSFSSLNAVDWQQ